MNHAEPQSDASTASTSLSMRLKWGAFRLLERASDLRGNAPARTGFAGYPASPEAALWVFVSTIGELNAIDAFLAQLVERLPWLRLVLITDHPHYQESYVARYPGAFVHVTLGHSEDARLLALHYPPRMLVVAEIPCLPSDAPCRFSFAYVRAAKRARAPAIVVNGWLYHYAPACRMDSVERRLFARNYVRAFDVLCMQSDDSVQELIRQGAHPDRISITGNIKFDAIPQEREEVRQAQSPRMLASLINSRRKAIVAGCVTSDLEQAMVLEAFAQIRCSQPEALLVLAPRHPEVAERMRVLKGLLHRHSVRACYRSSMDDAAIDSEVNCLVLDTMGDLRDFYSAATVAHVGVDHNVLEPLGFRKPVTVTPGWEATFPSWPVYRTLMARGALLEASDASELFRHWNSILASDVTAQRAVASAESALSQGRGAVERHFDAIAGCLVSLTRNSSVHPHEFAPASNAHS